MGRNNRDYKIKDKNLTKNKKNAKLNKSIAFTLAGMATIGAGSIIGGQSHKTEAMLGRVGSSAMKIVTSRALTGAPGAINSGKLGSNGTQFKGIPRTVRQVSQSQNNGFTAQTTGAKRKLSTTSSTSFTSDYGSNVKSLKNIFESTAPQNNSTNKSLSSKQSSKTQDTKGPIITTQGFYRK